MHWRRHMTTRLLRPLLALLMLCGLAFGGLAEATVAPAALPPTAAPAAASLPHHAGPDRMAAAMPHAGGHGPAQPSHHAALCCLGGLCLPAIAAAPAARAMPARAVALAWCTGPSCPREGLLHAPAAPPPRHPA